MTGISHQQPATRPGLKARVIRAGSWIMGASIVSQALRLLTNLFLARLLFPDAFGLMAVVYMLATALTLFSDLGVSQSVVLSKRGNDPDFLDTAWTLHFIRTQVLAVAVVVVAVVVECLRHVGIWKAGTVYADTRLPPLIGSFALVLVFQSFESVRMMQATRNMHAHIVTKIEMSGQVASAVVMVLIAWTWHSVWTLLVGGVVASALRCFLGYRLLPGYSARFRIHKSSAQELMGHAKWIMLSSIAGFLAANGDRIFLGGAISSREFGLYSIAIIITAVVQSLANSIGNGIVFPAMSEVYRDRPAELPRAFERFQWGYDLMVVFPAAVICTAGSALINVMYDSRYHDAGWMLSILSIGLVGMRYQVVEMGYLAMAKTNYVAIANVLRFFTMGVGLFIGNMLWGLVGAVGAVALSQYAAWPLAVWFKRKHRVLTWRSEALMIPLIIAGLLLGFAISLFLKTFVSRHLHH